MGKYLTKKWIPLQQLMKGMGQSSYPLSRKSVGSLLTLPIVKKGELLTSLGRWGGGRVLLLHARRGNAFAPQLEVLKQVYESEGGAHFTLGLERRRRILNFELLYE